MLKKTNPERKKKRTQRRILVYSIVFGTLVSIVSFGAYHIVKSNFNKPLFVSPLASIRFAQASHKESKIDILKRELQKRDIEVDNIVKESKDSIVIVLKNGGRVTFSSQKDIITQIASLQYILSHLTMEGKLFSRLDLRFEKPVIVLK